MAESIIVNTGGGDPQRLAGQLLTDRSGDLWDIQTRRRDYFISGEGTYVITFTELHRFLYRNRLTTEATAILNWMLAHIDHKNLVGGVTSQNITADTGILQPNISRSLKKLTDLDIIRRKDRSEFWLNPRYFFKGKPSEQKEAVKQWDGQAAIDQAMAEKV
jgi:hypothetical protein